MRSQTVSLRIQMEFEEISARPETVPRCLPWHALLDHNTRHLPRIPRSLLKSPQKMPTLSKSANVSCFPFPYFQKTFLTLGIQSVSAENRFVGSPSERASFLTHSFGRGTTDTMSYHPLHLSPLPTRRVEVFWASLSRDARLRRDLFYEGPRTLARVTRPRGLVRNHLNSFQQ